MKTDKENTKTLSLVCTSCGGNMELSADGKTAVCPYCGNKMLIEKEELARKEYERLMAKARAEEDIKDYKIYIVVKPNGKAGVFLGDVYRAKRV